MAKTNLKVVERKADGYDINKFNLDSGFIRAILDVMVTVTPDELNRDTLAALSYEGRNKLEKMDKYTNSLLERTIKVS